MTKQREQTTTGAEGIKPMVYPEPGGEALVVEDRTFDLEERTARFGEAVIGFCKSIPMSTVTTPLISQIVRSATSIGANYCEADNAVSKKEFRLKIGICQKETRETKHWLRMIAAAAPSHADSARALWQEARELHLIFSAILRKE